MASQDDLSLLKDMHRRGEISEEQYDVLRRHVLWGTPLPHLLDEVPAPATPPADRRPPTDEPPPPPGPDRSPADGYPPTGYGPPVEDRSPRWPPVDERPAHRPAADERPAYRPAAGERPPYRPPADGYPPAGYGPAGGYPPLADRPPVDRRPPSGYRAPSGPPPDEYSPSAYLPPAGPPADEYSPSAYLPPAGPPADEYSPSAYLPPAGPPADSSSAYLPPAGPPVRRARREAPDDRPPYLPPADAPPPPGSRRARREAAEAAAATQLPADPGPPRRPDPGPPGYDPRPGPVRPAYLPPTPPRPAPADATGYLPGAPGRRDPVDGTGYLPAARRDPGGDFGAPVGWGGAEAEPGYVPSGHRPGGPVPADDLRPADEPAEPAGRRARRAAERKAERPGRRAGGADPDPPDADPPGRRDRRAAKREAAATERRARAAERDADVPVGATVVGGKKAPRRRSVFAVLTSLVLALALTAAGVYWFVLRDPGVKPADYARSVCGSVRDWQAAVDSGSSALVTRIAREDDKTAVRDAVQTYYTDLGGRTDQLRVAVLDAGVADVTGGRAYADSLAAAVGDQATALRDLAARAGRLDPAASATFTIQLQSLLTGSETAVSAVSAALARPSAGTPVPLRTALGAEPACAPYVG